MERQRTLSNDSLYPKEGAHMDWLQTAKPKTKGIELSNLGFEYQKKIYSFLVISL